MHPDPSNAPSPPTSSRGIEAAHPPARPKPQPPADPTGQPCAPSPQHARPKSFSGHIIAHTGRGNYSFSGIRASIVRALMARNPPPMPRPRASPAASQLRPRPHGNNRHWRMAHKTAPGCGQLAHSHGRVCCIYPGPGHGPGQPHASTRTHVQAQACTRISQQSFLSEPSLDVRRNVHCAYSHLHNCLLHKSCGVLLPSPAHDKSGLTKPRVV